MKETSRTRSHTGDKSIYGDNFRKVCLGRITNSKRRVETREVGHSTPRQLFQVIK